MVGHIRQTSNPVIGVEVLVSPPSIPIIGRAAPHALGDVVIQVDIDLLFRAFRNNGIEDLQTMRFGSFLLFNACARDILTCSLVVEALNCGLFAIIFANTLGPLVAPRALVRAVSIWMSLSLLA